MLERLNIRFGVFGLLFFSWFTFFSQTKDSIVSAHIEYLSSVWNKNYNVSFSELVNPATHTMSDLQLFYNSNPAGNNLLKKVSLQKQINLQEQIILKHDPGFNFIAGYQKNFQSPFADPEDIVVFRQRFQTGIQWDFFRAGLYENRSKLKQLKYKQKALEWQAQNAVTNAVSRNNFNLIVYLLNEEKIYVLKKRKELIESLLFVSGQLLSLNQISKENYIKIHQHLNDIVYQLNVYERYNEMHANLKLKAPEKINLPSFDIDYNKVTEKLVNSGNVDSSSYYATKVAGSQNYFLNDLSLNANVKYNFYDVYNSAISNRSFLSVGVNLSMPLALNQKNKREKDILTAMLLNERTAQNNVLDTQNVILNSLYEFKYKQKQYGNLLQKRELFDELLRSEQVKFNYGSIEFNPLTANLILDDYWSTVVELLDLKQDMYRILNELKMHFPSLETSQIVKPYIYEKVEMFNDKNLTEKKFKAVNAVYIWSDVFKDNTPSAVINYCKLNNFNTLIVSAGKGSIQQLNEMSSLNTTFNYELMISNNNLLDGDIGSHLDSLDKAIDLKKMSAIHLDVEPHTFADFKTNKETYFAKYLQLISKAHAFTQNHKMQLSVSIPLNYSEDVLKVLFEKCDHIYLMAYENVKPAFISEKIKEELALGKEKVIVALRTNDFLNKAGMDALFLQLGVKDVAYHDLDELIKQSKKNLEKGNGK